MPKITLQAVEYVAKLARLKLTLEEKEGLVSQLDRILQYMDKLNELDTTQVEPTSHPFDIGNVLREDVVTESSFAEDLLKAAPKREGRFLVVPRVIE